MAKPYTITVVVTVSCDIRLAKRWVNFWLFIGRLPLGARFVNRMNLLPFIKRVTKKLLLMKWI